MFNIPEINERRFYSLPYNYGKYRKILGRIFRKYYFKVLKKLDNPRIILSEDFVQEINDEIRRHLSLIDVTREDELVEMTVTSLETLTKNRVKNLSK